MIGVKRQDRRGFEVFFAAFAVLILLGANFLLRNENVNVWSMVSASVVVISVFGCYIIEKGTRPPRNDASNFIRWKESNKSDVPTLVCLGDSLTHGAASANWVNDILPSHGRSTTSIWSKEEPLHIVNCGQNNLISYTCLKERVDWTLACQPKFVVVMIGTNDCRGIYNLRWRWQLESMWWTPKPLSIGGLEDNVESIVQRLIRYHPQLQVGLCTLPPLGEDLTNRANTAVVCKANERIKKIADKYKDQCTLLEVNKVLISNIKQNQIKLPVLLMYIPTLLFAFPRYVVGVSLDKLSKLINNQVMFEGVHLNETGGRIVTELVVSWLHDKGLRHIGESK